MRRILDSSWNRLSRRKALLIFSVQLYWKATQNMKFNLNGLARKAQVFTSENSPTILTAIGVTGALTGAYLASKATVKAVELVEIEENQRLADRRPAMDKKDKFKLLWKLYIPAAGVMTLTCASMICANKIGMRRTAAAAAALAVTERGWDEYREQAEKVLGQKKAEEVRENVAKKKVDETAEKKGYPVIISTGKVLIHDEYTNQFFEGTINQVDAAVNEINREITRSITGSQTVSDFYDLIGEGGPQPTSLTNDMGWNEGELLTIKWTTVPGPNPDSPAAHSYEFETRPRLRPWADASFR